MNKSLTIYALGLVLSALIPQVLADGFYGAIDRGVARGNAICTGSSASGCQDAISVPRIAGGYQFSPNWGTEFSIGITERSTLGSSGGYEVAGWRIASLLQASATVTLPLGDSFDLIGKVGIAQTKLTVLHGGNDTSAATSNLAFGLGAQYSITKSFAVRAQYEDLGTVGDSNTIGTTKMNLITAGLIFRF